MSTTDVCERLLAAIAARITRLTAERDALQARVDALDARAARLTED